MISIMFKCTAHLNAIENLSLLNVFFGEAVLRQLKRLKSSLHFILVNLQTKIQGILIAKVT